MPPRDIIDAALSNGQSALSEYDSKRLLAEYHIPVVRELLARSPEEALEAVRQLGYPAAMKACAPELIHKSDGGFVALNISNEDQALETFDRMVAQSPVTLDGVLVQEMAPGSRELVIGLVRDPQFGPLVMLGLGGVLTEIINDVVFRMAPIDRLDALDMMEELKSEKMLEAFRGQEPAKREQLAEALIGLGRIGAELEAVGEIDVNPILIKPDGRLTAVDAVVILRDDAHDQ